MSYTTRCPACGTMFKVVPDQLKISDGWVRCGHCADVFDATLHLETWVPPAKPEAVATSDPKVAADSTRPADAAKGPAADASLPDPAQETLPAASGSAHNAAKPSTAATSAGAVARSVPGSSPSVFKTPVSGTPPPVTASVDGATSTGRPLPEPAPSPAASEGDPQRTAVLPSTEADFFSDLQRFAARSAADVPDQQAAEVAPQELSVRVPKLPRTRPSPAATTAAVAPAVGSPVASAAASLRSTAHDPERATALATGAEAAADAPPVVAPTTAAVASVPEAEGVEPEFVQRARRKAYWQTPTMRASLMAVALLLAMVLAVQWSFHERNRLVAWKPSLQPAFESACAVLGCSLAPVQSIDDIVIDSTALVRRLGNFYSFDLVLKNTATIALQVPALELTLTDAGDNVLSRRVFLPQDMPGAPDLLAAGGSMSVSLRLSIALGDSVPMSGYRALVFYP